MLLYVVYQAIEKKSFEVSPFDSHVLDNNVKNKSTLKSTEY